MDDLFCNVKKNFGFGMMRLPMVGEDVDIPLVKQMVDRFIASGFNYFDTAHGYINGKSELAIRECLTTRYPRESYILTNKLSANYFASEADIRPLFQQQLEACGVDYFDFYLMHAQSRRRLDHFQQTHAYEIASQLKDEGKIRHIGISFHDNAETLEMFLNLFPQIEVVQLQFNYADYENPKVESRKCYEVCRKYRKPVLVMEPVKGGSLVDLPVAVQTILNSLHGGSNASFAIRYAASFPGIAMVLSGMSNMAQMEDNLSFMTDFVPLTPAETDALELAGAVFRNQGLVPCTGCRYCTETCPQAIDIPELFSALNAKRNGETVPSALEHFECLSCGKCEDICPQELNIRELLTVASSELSI